MVARDAVHNRKYTDEEVLAIRAAWEASSDLSPSTFAKQYAGSKTCWGSIYWIVDNRSYKWLLPGQPYRIEYDRKKAAADNRTDAHPNV